jgi:NAD(P)-dependent dehydrogenase (short-subunit alcohol dehydrogenase family)
MNILITGASSGIGLAIAQDLSRRGHRVFGTSRKPDGAGHGFDMLSLDVTNDASVAACVEEVLGRVGRIDMLINNAGYALYGAAEETSMAELDQQMQANFYGMVRMTQAVLPSMRAHGAGKIINMSSVNGLLALPYTAAYSASKFALEGYSEALRYELLPLGIAVSLIEPGGVKTGTQVTAIRPVAHYSALYGAGREQARQDFMAYIDRAGIELPRVVEVVAKIIAQPRPALRYRVGTSGLHLARALSPQSIWESLIRRRFAVKISDAQKLEVSRA